MIKRLYLVLGALLLQGCESLGYYLQSAHGHFALLGRSEPIERLLEAPATDLGLKERLRRVQRIRSFASERLLLPDNGSYTRYAALDTEAVVWSLVATPEFSMQPRQWCYPVLGCASYRGYFEHAAAQEHARELAVAGWDVAVEPVPAYSTLGWFDDPLPSTVIDWPEPLLAGLIFHELAHQRLYVKGDSAFNEAFASAVEQIGVTLWLGEQGEAAALEAWRRRQERERAFIALLLEMRGRLEWLYAEPVGVEWMRARKAHLIQRLRQRHDLLASGWEGGRGFDHWFRREVNNARLASVATYRQWLPAFLRLYREGDGMAAFLDAAEALSRLPMPARDARLRTLLTRPALP
ncbi:MAG: aminopeptidase [gamma proteobacterium symbiont of Phacoides pectinatus]